MHPRKLREFMAAVDREEELERTAKHRRPVGIFRYALLIVGALVFLVGLMGLAWTVGFFTRGFE